MTYFPDYGLAQLESGIRPDVDQCFYDFRLYSLTVLGRGQYSTFVQMPLAGTMHALSLDFSQAHLDRILAQAEPRLAAFIRGELKRDPASPRTIEFEGFVSFAVRAQIGPVQVNGKERYAPLVAQEILEGGKA